MRNLIEELEVFESRRLEEGLVTSVDMVLSILGTSFQRETRDKIKEDKQAVELVGKVYGALVNRLTDGMSDKYWDALNLAKRAKDERDPERVKKMLVDAANLIRVKLPKGM